MEEIIFGSGIFLTIMLGLLFLALPLIAIIHVLVSRFRDSTTKLMWLLVIFFIPFIGAILYFIIGRNQRIKAS